MHNIISERLIRIHNGVPRHLGIKVNLYNELEILALEELLITNPSYAEFIECIMVGDSYFNTHIQLSEINVNSQYDIDKYFDILYKQVCEVATQMQLSTTLKKSNMFLVADLTLGTTSTFNCARRYASKMYEAGADIIKIEVENDRDVDIVDKLIKEGFKIMGHIGFTPQKNKLRRYGNSANELRNLFRMAKNLKEVGTHSLVLEMVAEPVNRILSDPQYNCSMPIYSIFSGRGSCEGQCLNIWDSVVLSNKESKYFPPTARIHRSDVGRHYTKDIIINAFSSLISITLDGTFPLSPKSLLSSADVAFLITNSSWDNAYA